LPSAPIDTLPANPAPTPGRGHAQAPFTHQKPGRSPIALPGGAQREPLSRPWKRQTKQPLEVDGNQLDHGHAVTKRAQPPRSPPRRPSTHPPAPVWTFAWPSYAPLSTATRPILPTGRGSSFLIESREHSEGSSRRSETPERERGLGPLPSPSGVGQARTPAVGQGGRTADPGPPPACAATRRVRLPQPAGVAPRASGHGALRITPLCLGSYRWSSFKLLPPLSASSTAPMRDTPPMRCPRTPGGSSQRAVRCSSGAGAGAR